MKVGGTLIEKFEQIWKLWASVAGWLQSWRYTVFDDARQVCSFELQLCSFERKLAAKMHNRTPKLPNKDPEDEISPAFAQWLGQNKWHRFDELSRPSFVSVLIFIKEIPQRNQPNLSKTAQFFIFELRPVQ
jgi:hypothetical protein